MEIKKGMRFLAESKAWEATSSTMNAGGAIGGFTFARRLRFDAQGPPYPKGVSVQDIYSCGKAQAVMVAGAEPFDPAAWFDKWLEGKSVDSYGMFEEDTRED